MHCRQPVDPPQALLLEAACPAAWLDDDRPVYAPVGCAHCHGGYLGRVGVFQVMPISPAMTDIILREGSALDMARQAATEGVLSLRQAMLDRAPSCHFGRPRTRAWA